MPCTFALGDGLLFSVESDKMDTWQAANQHACFRAVAHMLAADQWQVKQAADRRHVRLMESHWNISIKDLRERITVVLHQSRRIQAAHIAQPLALLRVQVQSRCESTINLRASIL